MPAPQIASTNNREFHRHRVERAPRLRALIEYRAFKRPGSVLLSHALRHSTIGAEGLNGRVRNGIGCIPLAITTRPFKRTNPDRAARCRSSVLPGKFPDRQIKFASLRISFCSRWLSPSSLPASHHLRLRFDALHRRSLGVLRVWRFPLRAKISLVPLYTSRTFHIAVRQCRRGGRCLKRIAALKVRRTSRSSD